MFLELFEAEVNEIIKRPLQVCLLNHKVVYSIQCTYIIVYLLG